MKKLFTLLLAHITCLVSSAAVVSIDDATDAANVFVKSNSPIDEDRSEVTNVIPHIVDGQLLCYIALRKNGGAIFVAADDRFSPILAVVNKLVLPDGTLTPKSQFWGMTNGGLMMLHEELDGTGSAAARGNMTSSSPIKFGKEGNGVRAIRRNANTKNKDKKIKGSREKWKKNRIKSSSIKTTSVNSVSSRSSVPSSAYVIPGFETGGKFTHWNQENAMTGFTGTKPCYNYYMCCEAVGGSNSNGLSLVDVTATGTKAVPCGCPATSLSCAAQVLGMKGIKDSSTYKIDHLQLPTADIDGNTVKTNATLINGMYDWSILPANYGGLAEEVTTEADFTDEMRELLGRVTYNFGLAVDMDYDYGGSGCIMTDFCGGINSMHGLKIWSDAFNDYGVYNETVEYEDSTKFTKRLEKSISAGMPVIFLIYGYSSGHAVNGVGAWRDSDNTLWVKLFMGWSGNSDAWVSINDDFSISSFYVIGGVVYFSGNDETVIPYTKEASGMVGIASSELSFQTNVTADASGFVREIIPVRKYDDAKLDDLVYEMSYDANVTTNKIPFKTVTSTSGTSVVVPDVDGWILNDSNHRGFPFGTPDNIDVAVYDAWKKKRGLMVISGDLYDENGADKFFTRSDIKLLIENYFSVYYVDLPRETHQEYKDCIPSYGIFNVEPLPREGTSTSSITFDTNKFWRVDNGRVAYGTYTNEYDIMRILRKGVKGTGY